MKRTFTIVWLVFSVTVLNLAYAVQSEPEDFRGINWGTELKPPLDLTLLPGTKGGESVYEKKGELLQIGDAKLESVSYGFYKNKFFKGIIQFKSASNFRELKEQLQEKFGSGKRPNVLYEQFFWDWPNVNVEIYYNSKSDNGRIVYYYKPIEKQRQLDKKDEEKKKRTKSHRD